MESFANAPGVRWCNGNTKNVSIISFNMHGFNQGIFQLKSLCEEGLNDIIFIQEHWLTNDLLRNLDCFKNDYKIFSTSAIDSNHGIM